MTSLRRCSIVPPYLLVRLARAEPSLAEAVQFALRDSMTVRHRRELTATRWPGGRPGGNGIIAWPLQRRAQTSPEEPEPVVPERAVAEPLVPEGAAPHRTVHDAQHGTTLPGVLVRGEGQEPSGDAAVDQAYDGLGATWDLLAEVYGRDSLDGQGLPLVATVHYARDYDNAFWDGQQMVFGDGDGVYFNGFTQSVDVIGHELAHGLTQYTAGLTYVGQSGALNESASDVWGSMVRQRVLGHTAEQADWLVGAGVFTDRVQGEALRSMKAPGTAYDDPVLGKDPQPATMADYVVLPHDADHDNGGVHINSGIPNHAFYLFATALGGYSWERAGQVWYDTMTTRGLIPRDVGFAGFAAATLTCAAARYGEGSEVGSALRTAWEQVGVEPAVVGAPPAEGEPPTPGEPPAGDGPTDPWPGP